ncbi:hypothetical protein Gferi_05045 [Geosporobacter ferrireducens]|uniref:Uncharacterized protein n=1 Tax=Geosporobacter ferrireducens TaxID=1424294 RepID=A0A1D8GDK6_9FIRM|nr:hypothetical protein Gferi_05045 [Geosporobacter ferrireducens]
MPDFPGTQNLLPNSCVSGKSGIVQNSENLETGHASEKLCLYVVNNLNCLFHIQIIVYVG